MAATVKRISETFFSNAGAKEKNRERPMNLRRKTPANGRCVKFSRIMRENHASAKKLFTIGKSGA